MFDQAMDNDDYDTNDYDEGEYGNTPDPEKDVDVRVAVTAPSRFLQLWRNVDGKMANTADDDTTPQSGIEDDTEHKHKKDGYPGRNVCSGVAGSFPYHLNHVAEGQNRNACDLSLIHI